MTLKEKIIEILKANKISPIKKRDLLKALDWQFGKIHEREVRTLIDELIIQGFPIGSSEKGYYYCYTEEQVKQAQEYLAKKIKAIVIRSHNLDRAWSKQNPEIRTDLFDEKYNNYRTVKAGKIDPGPDFDEKLLFVSKNIK